MCLADADIDRIHEKASTLAERLACGSDPMASDGALARRRLSRWKHLAGEDYSRQVSSLGVHLGLGEITEDRLLAALGPVNGAPDGARPAWLCLLSEIVEQVARCFASEDNAKRSSEARCGAGRAIPYEHLHWPIAKFALDRVLDAHSADISWLHVHARHGLMKHLVRQISVLASPVLHPEFLAYLATAQSGMMQDFFGFEEEPPADTKKTGHYRNFVTERGEDGLRSFFLRFPVAARLIAETVLFWIEFVGEFLARLRYDRNRLEVEFNAGVPAGRLRFIKAGVSDSHDRGRSVLILGFEGGLRVVYKPRPMQVDLAFYTMVAEINALAPDPGLRALQVVHSGDYGWIEFADHDTCHSQRAAEKFYHRAGSLACLVHWLRGIDFHRENIVASGEYPVLVDLEGLSHPLRAGELAEDVGTEPSWPLAGSVLRTGLLPVSQSRFGSTGHYDASALGAPVFQHSLYPGPVWRNVNTDSMEYRHEAGFRRSGTHRPRLHGRRLSLPSFDAQVMAGFRQMANVLQRTSSQRLSRWQETIHSAPRRHIKKHTLVYRILAMRSLETGCLIAGIDRSIELCALPCEPGDEEDWFQEITSLEQLDVPYFRTVAIHSQDRQIPASPEPLPWETQEQLVKLSLLGKLEVREGRIYERLPKT